MSLGSSVTDPSKIRMNAALGAYDAGISPWSTMRRRLTNWLRRRRCGKLAGATQRFAIS